MPPLTRVIRQLLTLAICLQSRPVFAGTSQSITFPEISYQIVPAAPVALGATASSGLPVSYSIVSPEGIATLSGNTITLTGTAGSVTVRARQAGDDAYDRAPDVYRTFAAELFSQRFVKVARGPLLAPAVGSHAVEAEGVTEDKTSK